MITTNDLVFSIFICYICLRMRLIGGYGMYTNKIVCLCNMF